MEPETAQQPTAAVQPQSQQAQAQPQVQPQSPPTQSATSQGSSGSSIDPGVLALEKQIGLAESGGNYEAGDNTGDGADSYGAFQMTPGFLENWAPKAGVQYTPGMTLTPEQQNEIAYNTIYTLGTTGDPADPSLGKLSPEQIASYWNSGNPDAYQSPTYGENNTYGSTQNEVSKIMAGFNSSLGINTANAASSSAGNTPSGSGGVSGTDVAAGAGALGLGAVAATVATDGGDLLEGLGSDAAGWLQDVLGITGLKNSVQDAATGGNGGGSTPPPATATPSVPPPGGGNSSAQSSQQQEITQSEQEASQDENQAAKQSATFTGAINENMQTTASNSKFASDPDGKQGVQTMGMYGYTPDIDENGRMDFTNATQEANNNESKAVEMEIAAGGGSTVPMADVINEGNQILQQRDLDPGVKADAQKILGEYARNYAPANGSISGEEAIKGRHQQYRLAKENWGKYSSAQIEARKALGSAFRNSSIKNSRNPTLQEAAIKEQQKHINAKKVMKRLHKKKAARHKGFMESFLKQGIRAAEIYIGEKIGGPIGAIIGGLVGEHFNNKIAAHYGKNNFDTPEMKKAFKILKTNKPKVYDKIIKKLKQQGFATPEDTSQIPQTKSRKVEQVKKGMPGLVDLPNASGAQKGEREIKKGEVMKAGKRIRMDMKTGKSYVSD